VVLLALLSLLPCFASWDEEHGLEATLVPLLKRGVDGTKNTNFKFVLEHPSKTDRPITFLKWNTPMDTPLYSSIFSVVNGITGESAQYIGRRGKRIIPENPAEAKEQFVTLQPGEKIVVDFDISKDYDLTSNETVTFNVTLETYVSFVMGTFEEISQLLKIVPDVLPLLSVSPLNSQSIHINSLPLQEKKIQPLKNLKGQITGCDQQKVDIFTKETVALATKHTSQAASYLQTANCDAQFITWFGYYQSSARWNTVKNHFVYAKYRFDTGNYNINCEPCKTGMLAYVYPVDVSHTIHFCDYSFTQSKLDQASTLIHEMTHFVDVGGTQDYVYGQAAAQQLARNNPNQASMCAENHNFFAEVFPRC